MSRIGIVLTGYSRRPVGGYRIVYTYSNYLADNGHDVTLYHAPAFKSGANLPSDPSDAKRPNSVREQATAAFWSWRLSRLRPAWFDLDDRVRLRHPIAITPQNIDDCDVLVATGVQTAPVVSMTTQSRGIPGAYFIQHFEDWAAPVEFVEATWRLPLTKIVIAPWLQDRGKDLGVNTVLVPNAIDSSDIMPGPPTAQRGISLIALVSDVPWKRTDLVVSVMNQLAQSHNGFTGATFGVCPRPVGLDKTVIHHENPNRSQLSALYGDSRVYLCASDAEGWHLPPAEAMAAGAAVVSTDIGGVRAYADSTALFAPVGNAAALVGLVRGLLDDTERCQRSASAGQKSILAYKPAEAAKAFEKVLLSLIS